MSSCVAFYEFLVHKRLYKSSEIVHSFPIFVKPFLSRMAAEMNQKNIGPLVCLLIIVMDVVAGILGIEAEVAQNKVSDLKVWIFECRDPSYEAFKLGFAAATLLIIAHAITNMLGGCIFIYSKEELDKASANKQLAIASLIFSWITLAIGFATLAAGALSNARSRKTCGISHHRYLSIGGIACFVHGLFAVAYYISAKAVHREDEKLNHQNHPHPPPPA